MSRKSSINAGDLFETKTSGVCKVLEYTDKNNILVKFLNTGFETSTTSSNLKKGVVKDPYNKSVFGIGFLGVGEFSCSHIVNGRNKHTPAYTLWHSMMARCYSENQLCTYVGCTVDERWHNFQTFAKDIKDLPGYDAWVDWKVRGLGEKMALDKDGIVYGNKIYSQNTCQFITGSENSLIALRTRWKKEEA